MNRPSPLIWIFLFLILILPTAVGRILLDLAGGLLLAFFTISLIIAGIGWLSWRKMNAMIQNELDSNKNTDLNSQYPPGTINSEASQATVDIIAKDADRT